VARQSINVTASPGCVTPFDLESRGLTAGLLRASVHYYNTDEEIINRFCDALEAVS
jgi:selenocysteine lyase/cysteine desulfurase